MAARTVYACETCQPLQEGTELAAARKQAMAGAKQHEVRCREGCSTRMEQFEVCF